MSLCYIMLEYSGMHHFTSFWCTCCRQQEKTSLFWVDYCWHIWFWIYISLLVYHIRPSIFHPVPDHMANGMTHMRLSQVHKTSWYMLHYGGPTPKRHYAFANTHHIDKLNLGQLRGWLQKKEALKELGQTYDLVDKYVDASGQPRWKGNKRLRSSEPQPYFFKAYNIESVQMMSNSIIFFRLRSAIICNQHFMAKGI